MAHMDEIQALSNERQWLWFKAGHETLTTRELERITYITVTLGTLWHLHRSEMAWEEKDRKYHKPYREPEGDIFIDFLATQGQYGEEMRVMVGQGDNTHYARGYEVMDFSSDERRAGLLRVWKKHGLPLPKRES